MVQDLVDMRLRFPALVSCRKEQKKELSDRLVVVCVTVKLQEKMEIYCSSSI